MLLLLLLLFCHSLQESCEKALPYYEYAANYAALHIESRGYPSYYDRTKLSDLEIGKDLITFHSFIYLIHFFFLIRILEYYFILFHYIYLSSSFFLLPMNITINIFFFSSLLFSSILFFSSSVFLHRTEKGDRS